MIPSYSPRKALLACPPFPPWNLLSFTVKSTLSSSCPRSDPPLSRQGAALAHLDSLPLMIWYSEQTALFLFSSARAAPAFLPTALSEALRLLFPFQQAQYVQVFPLKRAPFCTLFSGFGSINKSTTSLCFSYYLTLVLFSPSSPLLHLSFYLKLCGRSGRNCLFSPPVLSSYNAYLDTRFYRATTRLMSWPDGERYLFPHQSPVVFLILSLVSTLVFSRTGGVLSHLNTLTHRFPRFPPRNLCSLVTLAVCSLVYAATNRVFCKASIPLELAESKIFLAALADTGPRTPLISFCTVQLQTFCVARSLAIFCLFTTSGPGPGELPGF